MKNPIFSYIKRKVAMKLAFTIAVIIIIVQSTFSYFEVISNKSQLEKELSENMSILMNIAANAFSDAVWNFNDESTQAITSSLMKTNIIAGIEVTDNYNRVLYTQKKYSLEYSTVHQVSTDAVIYHEIKPIGKVNIDFTSYFLEKSVKSNTLIKIYETLLMTLLLIIAVVLTSLRITKPINELILGTDEIASGNLLKMVQVESSDEIGALAIKFNNMTHKLYQMMQDREKALEALVSSEEKFSKAFQSALDIIGIVRLSDRHIVDFSNSFFESFGYEKDEVIEHTTEEFGLWSNVKDRDLFYSKLAESVSNNRVETSWKTKLGQVNVGLLAHNLIEISGEACLLFVWHDITIQKKAEETLKLTNEQLEETVIERTKALSTLNDSLICTNEELSSTVDILKKTQAQLIQSEKMAGLGTLVAGVAHEINTPLGVAVTATTYLNDLSSQFNALYHSGEIKRQDLEKFMIKSNEAISMIINNLNRASKLIHSFKQVSVDQSSEAKRVFAVKAYLEELLLSLHPKLKKTKQMVKIICAENLSIESYPGALAQIITNLIMNSLIHAYAPEDAGEITIKITQENNILQILYKDDGKGMSKEVKDKIFEPFFTTKRLDGGTGLGLHVIYNIITLQLEGSIECKSEINQGSEFLISIPLSLNERTDENDE